MTGRVVTSSPRRKARVAGALYLISDVLTGLSFFVLSKIIVRGDPAATAANIVGSEDLFRLGFVAEVIGIMIFAGPVPLLYLLFRPVNRSIALLAAFFSVMGCVIQAMDSLGDLGALLSLKGGSGLTGFTADQSQALAVLFLNLHSLTYALALGFFGASAILTGYLILRSTFLPQIIGVLLAIAGVGYLTFFVVTFASPLLAAQLYPYVPFGTALGEGGLTLWFVVKGVNAQRWEEQAAAASGLRL